MFRPLTLLCNLLWLLTALPGWLLFQAALRNPKRSQQRILKRILRENADTDILKEQPFHQRHPSDYASFLPRIQRMMQGEEKLLTSEQPLLLEPTGGSTSGPKLIPYTPSLKREFQRAVQPWIAGLFLKWPHLLLGRQYWCLTPSTAEDVDAVIPVGFESDAEYLGHFQRIITRGVFAVPAELARCKDHDALRFQTIVHLLNTPDLRLISVWHPSLLVLLLETLEERFEELVAGLPQAQARHLKQTGCVPGQIWKKLRLISCWEGPTCKPWIRELQQIFPGVHIQPKGLLATEGISSFPLGGHSNVAAVRSHYYEFICAESGDILPLWKLQTGKTYSVVLTTGGGLYRYRTHDLVEVTGFRHRTPLLRFLHRDNQTSDLVGEKISQGQADEICAGIPCEHRFAMIAPEGQGNRYGYVLYIESTGDLSSLAEFLEKGLCKNYHYRHARQLGQLAPAIVRRVDQAARKVRQHLILQGQQEGNIKFTALRTETNWREVLLPELSSGPGAPPAPQLQSLMDSTCRSNRSK